MKSNRKSPIWPYLIVLAGLFLLSVAAPRSWQTRPAARRELTTERRSPKEARERPLDRAIVLLAEPRGGQDRGGMTPLTIERTPKPAASLFEGARRPTVLHTISSALTADPADAADGSIATDQETAATSPDGRFDGPSYVSIDEEPIEDASRQAESEAFSTEADEATQSDRRNKRIIEEAADSEESDDQLAPNYDKWPAPNALIESLERLARHAKSREWAIEVRTLLDQLAAVPIDDPAAAELLRDLRLKTAPATAPVFTAPVQRQFQRARFDLLRRLDLWEQAAAAIRRQLVFEDAPAVDEATGQAVAAVNELVYAAPIGDTWRDYLLLDRIAQLARDTSDEAAAERHRTAQIVLARMADSRLSAAQRDFLAQRAFVALERRLRRWAIERLAVGELLHTVEAYEQARVASLGGTLAEQASVLAESQDPAEQRLGGELDRHYRNANLRLVVTRELLGRLLPQPEPAAEEVNDTIVGVPTRGVSTTSTKLSVRLFPAVDQIRLGIEAAGVVDSQTSSTSGPVTLHSAGASTYFVGKLVVIDRGGLRVGAAMAEADNQSRLAGLVTEFDGIPLVRNLVRGYALAEHEEKQPEAQQEVEAKIAARASERLDAEVNARLAQAESEFRRRLLTPLTRLHLHPTVVQLSTTEDRVTARLRLAGDDQAGAHTPRPLALSNSLASLQVHESALNNALDRFELAGRTFTLLELQQWIGQRLGRNELPVPDDLPEDVVVTFAEADPVRVRCTDGRVELTLAIAELDEGRRAWYDFEIVVCYHPRIAGLRAEFVRDGPIELLGEAYAGRTEIVLRGIFAKVFPPRKTVKFEPALDRRNARLATLEFNSAVVDNGWISVTVADRRP